MNDVSFLSRPGSMADIDIRDPHGRSVSGQAPVTATPGVAAGVAIGYALIYAFNAGLNSTHPTLPHA
ncbi:hypothetical protein ACFVWN_31320 [Nocardiopsis flavescens]|uniref:Uncharacterized protein n=1 Tax=Nocardiopsis flavescens TaxID=758803 RepID=A0A1M6QXR8_9ACTN|nr:hypothetical protein [Nocardiopsis flavescens]SHK25069.1 hypothetical protein SAMN05421803_11674 [Nocardiopsis flavescens]